MKNYFVLLLFSFLFISSNTVAQKLGTGYIAEQIKNYKLDSRGPYRDIRWFCTDGSIRDPKDPCPEKIGPGMQHARYKTEVENIGSRNHIFLGQIVAYHKPEVIWDSKNNQSRLKQYQLGKYLGSVDNGWILAKAQYYRGAIQAEDEEAAGIDFYKWVLTSDENVKKHYFLIRQSLKDVPHSDDNNAPQLMRSQSKVLSDGFTPFMDLRIKIHGQPEYSDIAKVRAFKEKHSSKLSTNQAKQFDELILTMEEYYKPLDINSLLYNRNMLRKTALGATVTAYINKNANQSDAAILIPETAKLLFLLRKEILTEKRGIVRTQILDVSLKLEEIIFKSEPHWIPKTIKDLNKKIYYIAMGTAGAGFIELWEWDQLKKTLAPSENQTSIQLGELTKMLESGRSAVEWSAAMVKANYEEIISEYAAFETITYGFIDDRIRGSIALHLGKTVGELGDIIASESSIKNKVMNITNQSSIRGLNPGYAFGELVVVADDADKVDVSSDKIYVFQRPPSDLKPIAGIATVAEGNMVSHVQLLARNLGIPNAALSDDNLKSLLKYNGTKVFYAVSNKGNVILKAEGDMTTAEKALFSKKVRKEEKIAVPIERIRLDETKVLNLRDIDASDSGNLCGPKAANLGQLKKMFPDNVVEGLVIPFGIFREHMDQAMPNQGKSYWIFLNDMFSEAEKMRSQNIAEAEVEKYQLQELEILRTAIKKMPLKAAFVTELEKDFKAILGKSIGEIPVFLRSDTNMEDLKDFTGAGLNLTLFNVSEKNKILDGIKDVWASPYTERSFKWRQKYLSNPENVFPSILVIPSVDVDHSGVLITKGLSSGDNNDLTVAFSRGAGGAVDGQAAEQYLIRMDETYDLIAPARDPYFKRLPLSGGTSKELATFDNRILSEADIYKICVLAEKVRETLPKETDSDYDGAYDVELGFKDGKLWLFQIRPFVENKKALSSDYLESITPKINNKKEISLDLKI